ncbi:YodC family protein [Pseudomonas sp. HLG18]|uniref:YodC family protein n=1 Tax=Pseudomonas sp. HLG18 TaxID=3449277 RepID=UPI003F7440B1
MSSIAKSDVVALKSGGPAMTVAEIKYQKPIFNVPESTNAFCQWFDGDKPMEKWYDVEVLERIETLPKLS